MWILSSAGQRMLGSYPTGVATTAVLASRYIHIPVANTKYLLNHFKYMSTQ